MARYLEQDTKAADERRARWRKNALSPSESSEATKWRQRPHRLAVTVQPIERPAADSDPWLLAVTALAHLGKLRSGVGLNGRERLDQVAEIIRQLAVGPED